MAIGFIKRVARALPPAAKHCSSFCSQSEGHEHIANMASALGHDVVGFLAVLGRHHIRSPHFASKVSYSASPQSFAYGELAIALTAW